MTHNARRFALAGMLALSRYTAFLTTGQNQKGKTMKKHNLESFVSVIVGIVCLGVEMPSALKMPKLPAFNVAGMLGGAIEGVLYAALVLIEAVCLPRVKAARKTPQSATESVPVAGVEVEQTQSEPEAIIEASEQAPTLVETPEVVAEVSAVVETQTPVIAEKPAFEPISLPIIKMPAVIALKLLPLVIEAHDTPMIEAPKTPAVVVAHRKRKVSDKPRSVATRSVAQTSGKAKTLDDLSVPELLAEAKALGIPANSRWKAETLRQKIRERKTMAMAG